jgi:hypothetical protein
MEKIVKNSSINNPASRKCNQIIHVILFVAMLNTILAGSGNGGQQPVKQENGNEAVQMQGEKAEKVDKTLQKDQTEVSGDEGNSGASATVKDRLGIDTGMTKEELESFKGEYKNLAILYGIPSGKGNSHFNRLIESKVNLKAFNEFKEHNLFLDKPSIHATAVSYQENSLLSEIIVCGKIDSVELFDTSSTCYIFIETILKGDKLLENIYNGKIPSKIPFSVPFGSKKVTSGLDSEPVTKIKGVYFLKTGPKSAPTVPQNRIFVRLPFSTLLSIDNSFYFERDINTKRHPYDLNLVFESIKRIIEINDSDDFYKRSYK